MLWALGAILLQFHAVPQAVVPAASRAAVEAVETPAVAPVSDVGGGLPFLDQGKQVQPAPEKLMLADASVSDEVVALEPGRLVPTPVAAPAAAAASPAASPAISPVIAVRRRPEFAGRITGGQQKAWLGLAIAQHSAATFDAWSTRRAITRGGAQELNPMLKPFAGNRSLYAAVQVGPALLDLLGRKMMHSRHSFLRRTWWLPQVLGTAASVAGGVHNLGVR